MASCKDVIKHNNKIFPDEVFLSTSISKVAVKPPRNSKQTHTIDPPSLFYMEFPLKQHERMFYCNSVMGSSEHAPKLMLAALLREASCNNVYSFAI